MKLSPTFFRFVAYAKRPVYYGSNVLVSSPLKTLWELFKVNLWSILGMFLLLIITGLIGEWVGVKEPESSIKEEWTYIFALIIVAPLLEELIFRWPLRYAKNRTIILAVIVFWIICGESYQIESLNKTVFWVVFSVGTVAVIALMNLYKNQIRFFWTSYNFKWIYWSLGLIFGLIHLSNYDGSYSSFLVYGPVLCIHQIVMGLLNGYARMRYGFWYGVALHAMNNLIVSLFLVAELLNK